MGALVHVLCGPAGAGKTRRLAEQYRSAVRSEVGTALWIGPNPRHVEALRRHLLGDLPACWAPNLFTFQDVAEEIIRLNDPAARPLANVQRRLLADDLVSQLHAEGELSHFQRIIDTRGFAEGVFAFLADLKRNGIRPDQLAQVVRHRSAGK